MGKLGVGCVLALVALPVAAQRGTLDTYRAAPTPEDDFHVARPTDLGHLDWGAHLHLDYALNPLVWEDELGDSSTERFAVVEHQLVGTVGVALGLVDRLVVYAALPFVLAETGEDSDRVVALSAMPADGAALGDVRIGARLRLFGDDDDRGALALQATLSVPSATGTYAGESSVSVLPMLLGEIRFGPARLDLNFGALIRERSSHPDTNLVFRHELHAAAGLAVRVWQAEDPRTMLELLAQARIGTQAQDLFSRNFTHGEWLLGPRFTHGTGARVALGLGTALARGAGSPDFRAVLMVGWATPEELEQPHPCADDPEDLDGFEDDDGCNDPDNDRDGILDVDDECPMIPENMNDWEDTDGCPDEIPDTDGDGILDPDDQCVDQPEDPDGFEDEDGCPDPDNDGDGVLDGADGCPLQAGPIENRGCPDGDRDEDTLIDRRDNCPDVPGPVENMGCPAEERQSVRIEDGILEILDTVYFRTDRDVIQRRSFALLDNVARVIIAHPEIGRVRVQGHTDSRGSRDHNLDLSNRRALSVVNYLVEHGVARERLDAVGYGPDRPVVENARTPAQHAENRRVIFEIVNLHGNDITTTSSGPTADEIDR